MIAVPISTAKGKGYWPSESVEHIFSNMEGFENRFQFLQYDWNYESTQKIIYNIPDHIYGSGLIDVKVLEGHYNPGFSGKCTTVEHFWFLEKRIVTSSNNRPHCEGFNFAMTRENLKKIFPTNGMLLDTRQDYRNLHQELQLAAKVNTVGGKICLQPRSFIFHYKGITRKLHGW